MTTITEAEFEKICRGISDARESIIKYNPIGPDDEVLLWMLLSTLVYYLNLTDNETPCFNGKANAQTYRDAILFVMKDRRTEDFDVQRYLDKLIGSIDPN